MFHYLLKSLMGMGLLVFLSAASPENCEQATFIDKPLVFDITQKKQQVHGFGIEIHPADIHLIDKMNSLTLNYVRMETGPRWEEMPERIPTDATRAEMDRHVFKYFDGDNDEEARIMGLKRTWKTLQANQIQVLLVQYQPPYVWLSKDYYQTLKREHLDDYARFWGSLLTYLKFHGILPQYIELSNEPDGFWNSRIKPRRYSKLVELTRQELNARGFSSVQILGPGLAFLDHRKGNRKWINALSPRAIESLGGWSSHAWDERHHNLTKVPLMVKQWATFFDAVNQKDPYLSKPIFISEYATGAVVFNGKRYREPTHGGDDTATETSSYAQRVYQNSLVHLNQGANVLILWRLQDHDWDPTTWGMFRSRQMGSTARPLYSAMKTLFSNIPKGAYVLEPNQVQSEDDIVAAGFIDGRKLILAFANHTDKFVIRDITFRGFQEFQPERAIEFHDGQTKIYDRKDFLQLGFDKKPRVYLKPESTLTIILNL